ncbi:MAG TPA: o-succinylbenzoate--CoA ligase [Chloroflexia bacterium]|nr:o-succinylbenzoate--CoA ligase [Chloroflexia bacterium]
MSSIDPDTSIKDNSVTNAAAGPAQFPNWLLQQVRERPQALAALDRNEKLTFEALYRQADKVARKLAAANIEPGKRVAVLMGSGLPFVVTVHALMQLRAVLVPLNLRLTPAELSWQLADVQADLLLADATHAEVGQAIAEAVPGLPCLVSLEELPEADYTPAPYYNPDDLHTIIYSSGTTGKPKGVRLLYRNHFYNASGSAQNLPAGPDDLWLAVLPLFHVGGLSIILRGLFYGMPLLVHESFNPAEVNRALDEQGVTIISVVANMLARMLDERQDRPYPPTFRAMLVGGGPVPAPLLERCARSGIPVIQTYGMTETASQAVTLAPQDALRKLGSAGLPLPGVELRLELGGEAANGLEQEGVGEILLRGPSITPGYDGRPEETARAWREGWFHTGDLGRLDAEGYLYVVDRRNDLIISGGENVYPAEVEAVLLGHPGVEEAGVIGIPDPRWGQVVMAFIKPRPGAKLDEAEIKEYCAAQLARYKVPSVVRFTGENLPRNAAGKLLRRVLRTDYMKTSY